MTKKRWRFFLTVSLALILVILVGYDHYDHPTGDKHLRYGMLHPVRGKIDIFHSQEAESVTIYRHIIEPLLVLNSKQELEPLLLQEIPRASDDYRSYHFKLKPNVYFHNGLPLTSEDVHFLFLRMFLANHPALYHPLYENIEGSEELLHAETANLSGFYIINDLEFVITLKQADSQFLYYLTLPYAGIFSHKAFLEDPYQWGDTHLVGTGAYRYDRSESKDHQILLKRFGAYHGMSALLPRIEFILYDDAEEILEAYRMGEVDIAPLPLYYYETFKNLPGKNRIVMNEPILPLTLFFNAQDPLLSDKRIRQAISMAIDRSVLEKKYPLLKDQQSYAFLNSTMFGASDHTLRSPYDIQEAKALMAQAGYPNGLRLVVYYHDQDEKEIWQILQEQLLAIDVNLILLYQGGCPWYKAMREGQYAMTLLNVEGLHPRGRDLFYRLFHSSQGDLWSIKYFNKDLDRWIDAMRMSENSYEISRINYELEDFFLHKEYMMIPITFLPKMYIMRSDLQYQPSPSSYHLFPFAHYTLR